MRSRMDIGAALFVCSLVFLSFVGGALVMLAQAFPSGFIEDAYSAGTAWYARFTRYSDPYATDLWSKERTDRKGVTVFDPAHAYEGLTLYTSGDASRALLIDMHGNVVHDWRRPFSTVWDESSAVRTPVPDEQVYFRKARMFPNGDLLALYEGVGDSPYGYGLVMLTADSEVRWKNLDHLHHDFDVTADGRVIALAHEFRTTPVEGADQFEPPFLEDSLVVISAQGRTLEKISLINAINESRFRSFLWHVPYYSMEDPLHANGVDYLDAQSAAWLSSKVPSAAEGQVLLSFRELAGGSVALIELDTGDIVWATRGPWIAQHDPDVLPGGTIQVFDNRGDFVKPGKSRVIEVDPATGGIVWSYTGNATKHPLDSGIRASQDYLPNGNTLITESSGGRLLEVTRDGRIVWEYVNPVRGGDEGELIPVVSWAQRIPHGTLDASFRRQLAQVNGRDAQGD